MQKALTATETRTAICRVFYFQGFVVKISKTIARLSTKRHAQNNTELNTYTTLTLIITLLRDIPALTGVTSRPIFVVLRSPN